MKKTVNVATIGIWHLGAVTSACFAAYGHNVVGIDQNEKVIANLNKGIPPIYEPGLAEMTDDSIKKSNLSFTTDFRSGLIGADYVAITFDTEVNEDDTPNLSHILEGIERAVPHLKDGVLLVISSQVPLGTCGQIRSMIRNKRPQLNFGIVCIPENLKLGEAISRFNSPDLLIIGNESTGDFEKARQLYGFVSGPILNVSLRTAEMVKHAINAFLACEISFSNELGNFCDSFGVDWSKVAEALHLDRRIGKYAFLSAGLGFGGGTLARDVGVLRSLAKQADTETALLDAIIAVNNKQNREISRKLMLLFGKIKGLRIGVLGLTYKPGTSTIRRSASIDIIKELVNKGVVIRAYDPKASFSKEDIGTDFDRCKSAEEVAESSNAILILTGWPEFRNIDFGKLKHKMLNPVIIDALNLMDADRMADYGFMYFGIGRGKQITPISKDADKAETGNGDSNGT